MVDAFLYPGEPNPSDGVLSDPTVLRSAEGAEPITGVADITALAGALDVTALETFSGSGDEAATPEGLAAVGVEEFIGNAAFVAAAATIAASAAQAFTGTLAATAAPGAVAASGESADAITGSVEVAAAAGAFAADGTVMWLAQIEGIPLSRSRVRLPVAEPQPVAIHGTADVTARPGKVAGVGEVEDFDEDDQEFEDLLLLLMAADAI